MARKPFGFLFLDCPSDHEIEGVLTTECDTIGALLKNRGLGTRVRDPFRFTTAESFEAVLGRTYKLRPTFVHVAGHGSRGGLGLIGATVPWRQVGRTLRHLVAPLEAGEKRILCLSCCYSGTAKRSLGPGMHRYFTGVYYFRPTTIGFDTSLTVWSMFYLKKTLDRPECKIVESINGFLEDDVLGFRRFSPPKPRKNRRRRVA